MDLTKNQRRAIEHNGGNLQLIACSGSGKTEVVARRVRDLFQLRLNAYRVLLTRGCDAMVVFVPGLSALEETYGYLRDSGFQELP